MSHFFRCFNVHTVYVQAQGAKNYPIIFGQLTNCDGSFLIGRTAQPDFEWSDLKGKHILAGRQGGMPAMTLQYVINQAGVSLDELNFDTSVQFDLMGAAFRHDTKYDYVTLFEPLASSFVKEGYHLITSVGADSGAVPYTTFSATKSYMEKNPETVKGFMRAIIKGIQFMKDSSTEEVAAALKPSFSTTDDADIKATIVSYLQINAWKQTPVMLEEDFERLQTIMQNAGTLPSKVAFANLVDNSIANALLEEMV